MGYLRPTVVSDRLIAKWPSARTLAEGKDQPSKTGDKFVQRVIKYIPAEVVGTYIAAGNLLQQKDGTVKPEHLTTFWVVFWITLVLSPVYMGAATIDWKLERKQDPIKWFQVLAAPVAFALWAFALGGPFASSYDWYDRIIASVTLIIGAFVIGGIDKLIDGIYRWCQNRKRNKGNPSRSGHV